MTTKKTTTQTEATTTNDMIDAGLANAPAAHPTAANQIVASDFGSNERSARRLKKAAPKAAVATAPESEAVNTMVEGGLATDFRSDDERAKSARRKQAKAIVASVSAATAAEIETPEVVVQPAAKKTKKVKAAAAPGDVTLARIAEFYLAHLQERGAGAGTIASYAMELKLATSELGAETRVADLTPARVQEFFDSARVTLLKSGKEKSPLSIAKTRRALRLALFFAQDRKLIEKAPVPEQSPAA